MLLKQRTIFLILIPLLLSAFTHLWNPIGFPDLFYDEGIYMRRAMHVLEGLGPQERSFYDHPYFGQLFLAGIFAIIGYPDSLNPTLDVKSMEALYLVPKILMGLLAIIDTFLIYKISERHYNKNVAFFASILFAVMPITWLTRRILLDSILLPFLLTSIFLAMYSKNSNKSIVFLSGIAMGLAIFTKIPVFVTIPLVGYLIYKNNNRNLKTLGLWFIPVILIPLIWPAQSITNGEFDLWLHDVLWQTDRQNGGFGEIVASFFIFDPVLLLLGTAGIAICIAKKDILILLWAIPFLAFLSLIGYVQYFHWIPILPVFCIASAKLLDMAKKISFKKIPTVFPFIIIIGIGLFGITSSTLLVTSNVSDQFDAAAFSARYIQDNTDSEEITIVSNPVYAWLFMYVYEEQNVFTDYRDLLFCSIPTDKILLIADPHFKSNINAGMQLQQAYDNSILVKRFQGGVVNYDTTKYPYTNMFASYDGSEIEIRTNDKPIINNSQINCRI